MNQLSPVGSHQTDPFTSQDEQQIAAIAGMVNQAARETEARIEHLETCATINAETIGHVAELRRLAAEQVDNEMKPLFSPQERVFTQAIQDLQQQCAEQAERIKKLEAALREAAPWLA